MENEPLPDDFGIQDHQVLATIEATQQAIARALRSGALPPEIMAKTLEHALNQAQQNAQPREILLYSVSQLINGYWDHIEKRKATFSCGFPSLDQALSGGLETGREIVLLGAPGSGKTTYANQIATCVANSGRPVLYVTMEESPQTLLAKTLARTGNINYTAVLKGWNDYRAKINTALGNYATQMGSQRLSYLDATMGTSLSQIGEIAQKHFERYRTALDGGSGVLIIDYLQQLARMQQRAGGSLEIRQIVSLLAYDLRGLARALDCCVIALASQSRASGYNSSNGSALSTAKESGDIEYATDVLMCIGEDRREERKGARRNQEMTPKGVMKPWLLTIDKNRLGPQEKKIDLAWFPERQEFGEVQEQA